MADNESCIFTVHTFEDIDLYELSETTRNENYKKLSEWICQYKQKQIEEHNRRFACQKRKEYEHEFTVLLNLVDSYISFKKKQQVMSFKYLTEITRIKKRICFMSNEIFRHISITKIRQKQLAHFLKKKLINDNFKVFLISCFTGTDTYPETTSIPELTDRDDSHFYEHNDTKLKEFIQKMFSGKEIIDADLKYINPEQFMLQYEEKLKDHIFLLDELVEILSQEYDRRVISTKTRFEEYLRPRKRILERIDEEIDELIEDLKILDSDEYIGDDDKEKLRKAFLNKRQELINVKKREFEKLNSIRMVSLNIKNGVSQFRELIDSLKKKLRYFKKRQFYIEKLARYGAEIPKFKNILEDLYSTFNKQIKKLQKSFLLFDISFQRTILDAIEDQSIINRIILSPGGIVDAELSIENPAPVSPVPDDNIIEDEEKKLMDDIEFALNCLKPYGEE